MRCRLSGSVVADEDLWLYDYFEIPAFSPQTVRDAIDKNPEGETLTLEINSNGGSVFAGFEMYSVLQIADCHTVAEIQSIAASAATTVMLGCKEVVASPVAQVMIHLPSCVTVGDAPTHEGSIAVLNSITKSILNGYALKCGKKSNRNELERLMTTSTWMTAQEAMGLGLVDKVLGSEAIDPRNFVNCGYMGSLDASSMRREYARLVAEGKAPARNGITPPTVPDSGTELARLRAALKLEQYRF